MNILISPNAFKGTISAKRASEIISGFLHQNFPEINTEISPIADGGDGTCDLLTEVLGLERVTLWTLDPYGRPVEGFYGWDKKTSTAYLDVSTSSGIVHLREDQIDPYISSSFGTGMLIRDAVTKGAKEIVLGLGGTATIDLGIGILAALGILFLDKNGREISMFSPEFLSRIKHIQVSPSKPKLKFTCLCDVQNLFFGLQGAIPVFGPQKGLKKTEFETYENLCQNLISKLFAKGKMDFKDFPGFGAAGGVALGLTPFFETKIEFGSSYFFGKAKINEYVQWADWIITGEGRYDDQSAEGKGSFELLKLAHSANKKITLISSGNKGSYAGFDHFVKLDSLDFSHKNLKIVAEEQLKLALSKYLNPLNWQW